MSVAEEIVPRSRELLSWAKICEQHPGEWVCLLYVENAIDGSIRAAQVIGHDPSMRRVLSQIGALQPDTVVVHTSARPLRSPHFEMTDEIRGFVRARR